MIPSFNVGTTLAVYRGVYLSAAQTVAYLNTITSLPVGITKDTVKDTTSGIPVAGAGEEAYLEFNDTVGAGGLVALDANGKGVPLAGITLTNTSVIGVLTGDAVAATGTIAKVLIQPALFYGQV